MKIDNIKDLKAVIKLCRTEGVEIIKVDGVELVLGKVTETAKRNVAQFTMPKDILEEAKIEVTPMNIPTDELTEEQLLYGSADPSVWQQPKQ